MKCNINIYIYIDKTIATTAGHYCCCILCRLRSALINSITFIIILKMFRLVPGSVSFVRQSFATPLVHFQPVRVERPFAPVAGHELRQICFPMFFSGRLMIDFARHCINYRYNVVIIIIY